MSSKKFEKSQGWTSIEKAKHSLQKSFTKDKRFTAQRIWIKKKKISFQKQFVRENVIPGSNFALDHHFEIIALEKGRLKREKKSFLFKY